MNGRNIGTKAVMEGIAAAKEAGLGVKVNMVVKKETNESQILPMARFCKEEGIQLRYIEFMDVGHTNGWQLKNVITKKNCWRCCRLNSSWNRWKKIILEKSRSASAIRGRLPK